MVISSVPEFLASLTDCGVLPPEQLTQIAQTMAPRFQDPRSLARQLLNLNWLTAYQINQIFQGHGKNLILGQYALLERLGEGGMGQVFKAKDQTTERVVAIKVLRKERMADPEITRRFRRGLQAAARLSHPNIVMTFEACHVNDTDFLVMEFVDGIDLNRLVRESGPLPAHMACDYIQQAALGLQHAYTQGVVHRDIKPSNLVMSLPQAMRKTEDTAFRPSSAFSLTLKRTTIKILDMGLARLLQAEESKDAGRVTHDGKIIGTPDFIAPEQTMNSSTVDIRADLYSLGCTFYFLLTGRVPFPEGTFTDKIFKHRSELPTPIDKIVKEVPAPVIAVADKLMAKNPADRYQTPDELAKALAALQGST